MAQLKKVRKVSDLFDWIWKRAKKPERIQPEPEKVSLRVTSHVARDLLQNAAYFNALPKAVAEYVTNAIDSAEADTPVCCEVEIKNDEIVIADNGSGMTREELSNFFQMHGENIQRKRGRTVRGKFGTGKSAAFGIASILQIETVKNGLLNVVELHRGDVEAAQDGQPIPVREMQVDQLTNRHAGTTIHIRNLLMEDPGPKETRRYLEKLIGQHLRSHKVVVNGVLCRYRMPEIDLTFKFTPPATVRQVIGPARCKLYASTEPLARDDNMVAVLCHGYLHAKTLAGKNSEPLIEYVFGEVDVPSLDDDPGPIPAFDNTRNLALNMQNPKIRVLENWLGECIEEVLRTLSERERKRQLARDQYLLRKTAGQIKSLLEADFRSIQERMPWASMPRSRMSADLPRSDHPAGQTGAKKSVRKKPSLIERGLGWIKHLLGMQESPADPVPRRGAPVEFEIHYVRQGSSAPRARYDVKEGVIYLNRDHPQLRSAEKEAGIASNTYLMLSFDIAFTEYALAVTDYLSKKATAYNKCLDANELTQEILDRLGRKAAAFLDGEASTAATSKSTEVG